MTGKSGTSSWPPACRKCSRTCHEGIKMHEAMAKHPYIFPDLMTKTLAAGDKGGFVVDAANQVADDPENEDDQRAKVKRS